MSYGVEVERTGSGIGISKVHGKIDIVVGHHIRIAVKEKWL